MSREKALVKNTLLYFVANFASKFLGFLLLPFYTHYLTKQDYGYYDLITTTVLMLVPILTLQLNDGIYRFLLDAKSSDEIAKVVTNSIFIALRNILIFCIPALIFIQFKTVDFGYLITVQIITAVLSGMLQQIARGLRNNLVFSISGILYTIVMLLSNIVLIIFAGMRVNALLYSSIMAGASVIIYIEWKLRLYKIFNIRNIDKSMQKLLVKFSIPLLPNSLNWWIMNLSSRYVINFYLGTEANGIFAVANKFPSVLMMLNSIFYLAWQESAITEYNSEDKNIFYTKMFKIYMKIQFSILLILLPMTKLAMNFMVNKDFHIAWAYIPFLYISSIFSSFSSFYGTGYLSSKETKGAFTTSVAGAGVNLISNLLLIPLIGLHAVPIANTLSFFCMWIFRVWQTRKYFNITIDKRLFLSLAVFVGIFTYLYYSGDTITTQLMIAASLVAFLLFNRSLIFALINFLRGRGKPNLVS